MRRALALAAQGLGRTSPNPAVGAVVVKEGAIVGEGWHRAAGQPHAEVEALTAASEAARGGTVYVTLEPCSHYGRTPPCTEALIAAGVKRVVYACPDCDQRCAGKAESILRQAGIESQCGPLAEEARRLNEAYFKFKQTGLPFVTLKLALTLDGRCATRIGDSQWITSEESRRRVHQMRDQADAVMIGEGTLLADNPRLTVRLVEPRDGRQPVRVVLAVDGIGAYHPILQEPGRTVIVMSRQAYELRPEHDRDLPEESDRVRLLPVKEHHRHLDLQEALHRLAEQDLLGILLEGGPSLAGRFLEQGLVDKLVFFYAPRLLLDDQALGPRVRGRSVTQIAEALNYRIDTVEQVGPDLMVTMYPEGRSTP